ncbi:MAG: DUF3883 domain-containing protein [Alphaproteobacteria bacterium]
MGKAGSSSHWSEREIDLIVADYFAMLGDELAGRPYVKAQHNAALQKLIGRSHKSVEFKHQNISAVLELLGLPWIEGYKPKRNFQRALIGGIERYLSANPSALLLPDTAFTDGLQERAELFVEPPPGPLQDSGGEPDHVRRLLRKFDPAERDARNRALGLQGEERVFHFERRRLKDADRDDLARKVRWVSQEDGDGAGYDILSFDPRGKERLLEVKTTAGYQRTPFFITGNERALSDERPDAFRLVRLYDFARQPRAFELIPPLEDFVLLRAANYRASFRR